MTTVIAHAHAHAHAHVHVQILTRTIEKAYVSLVLVLNVLGSGVLEFQNKNTIDASPILEHDI